MAEIAIIASIAGIAAAGSKLSVALFDFGSTVGSAGYEIRQVGSEISLFCCVLKQVQSKLRKAKSPRYSLGAIQTTQKILDQCEHVFKEIEAIIDSLRKETANSAERTIDWKARIKWAFKKSHIQLQRTTLQSCKITLSMMLITLDFNRKVASRRTSTVETEREDEEEKILTKTLLKAHRCTIDTLEKLEAKKSKKTINEVTQEMETSSIEKQPAKIPPKKPSATELEGFVFDFEPVTELPSPRVKRASLWASDLIYGSNETTGSSKNSKNDDSTYQLNYFLQKWTNQNYPPPPHEPLEKAMETPPQAQPLLTIPEIYIAQLKATFYTASNTFDQIREHEEKIPNLTNMEKRALSIRSTHLDQFLVVVNRELLEVKQYNQLNLTLATTSRTLKLGVLEARALRASNRVPKIAVPKPKAKQKLASSRKMRLTGEALMVLPTQDSTPNDEKSPKVEELVIKLPLEVPKPKAKHKVASSTQTRSVDDALVVLPTQSSTPKAEKPPKVEDLLDKIPLKVSKPKPKKKKIGWHIDQSHLPAYHGRYPYPLVSPDSNGESILSPLISAYGYRYSFEYGLYVKYADMEHPVEADETPLEVWKKMAVVKVNSMLPLLVVRVKGEQAKKSTTGVITSGAESTSYWNQIIHT